MQKMIILYFHLKYIFSKIYSDHCFPSHIFPVTSYHPNYQRTQLHTFFFLLGRKQDDRKKSGQNKMGTTYKTHTNTDLDIIIITQKTYEKENIQTKLYETKHLCCHLMMVMELVLKCYWYMQWYSLRIDEFFFVSG